MAVPETADHTVNPEQLDPMKKLKEPQERHRVS
jgi:hypothetical protein